MRKLLPLAALISTFALGVSAQQDTPTLTSVGILEAEGSVSEAHFDFESKRIWMSLDRGGADKKQRYSIRAVSLESGLTEAEVPMLNYVNSFSPSVEFNRLIVVSGSESSGIVSIDGNIVTSLYAKGGLTYATQLSPDGKYIALESAAPGARYITVFENNAKTKYKQVYSVSVGLFRRWSADSRYFLAIDQTNLIVIDAVSGKTVRTYQFNEPNAPNAKATSVSIAGNATTTAVGYTNGEIRIRPLAGLNPRAMVVKIAEGDVATLVSTNDGSKYVAGADGELVIVNAQTGAIESRIAVTSDQTPSYLEFSRDGQYLLALVSGKVEVFQVTR